MVAAAVVLVEVVSGEGLKRALDRSRGGEGRGGCGLDAGAALRERRRAARGPAEVQQVVILLAC